jgi:ribulose-5-phosphate 4-epimerase/fuculose-1-phosphate aldolase
MTIADQVRSGTTQNEPGYQRPTDSVERELRIQLAAVYRLVHLFNWTELIWSHTTVKLPGPQHHFLINPYGLRYDEVTASGLLTVDGEGNVVAGADDRELSKPGFMIHSAVHMARPDLLCVMHVHTVPTMAIAALQDGLAPISMHALSFTDGIAYHDFEGPSLEIDERERLAKSFGDKRVMILRNHGPLTTGATIAEAFVRMYRLHRACEVQLAAQGCGIPLTTPSMAVQRACVGLTERFATIEGKTTYGAPEFAAFMRLIDRLDPSYRD